MSVRVVRVEVKLPALGCVLAMELFRVVFDLGVSFHSHRAPFHLPPFRRENLFNTSETRTLPTEYHPSFFIPAKTQRFTHGQEINISTFRRGGTIKKIPKKLPISLKISET